MMSTPIIVIDYGMGNLWSVLSALRYLGCDPVVSDDPDEVARAPSLLLPGVGSFRRAMETLQKTGLDQAIDEAVSTKGSKILGICLGMQLLGSQGTEDGTVSGLGLIANAVDKFQLEEVDGNKIPHIGFDTVYSVTDSQLFKHMSAAADFYFVHSYRMLADGLSGKVATCRYGVEFLAAYEQDNIYATQFHPEKSQTNGLMLLRNFLSA